MSMFFYRAILRLARPLVRLRLRRRAKKEPEYGERVAERFGEMPEHIPTGVVWFHTVSAGETIAASPLIRELKEVFPNLPFLVTTMTPTGSAQVQERLGDVVSHSYAPYDFSDGVERFFNRVQPKAIILMETELWPNWVRFARTRSVPVMAINARLSEKSARGYARLGSLVRNMLDHIELIACQTRAHRDRFVGLGAAPQKVVVTGSVKFDVSLPQDFTDEITELKSKFGLGDSPTWIAASTHPGEDEIVLAAHAEILSKVPNAKLILVPRHPVRVPDVSEMINAADLSHALQSGDGGSADVLLGDVMGTLQYLYGLADCAFVGGSLVDVGGHNPIEPALCEIPVASGPHQHNFTEIMESLSNVGGLKTITGAGELAQVISEWLTYPDLKQSAGQAAAKIVAENRGAQEKVHNLVQARIAQVENPTSS